MILLRVCSSSADPAGRGPNSTCLRTCSKARSPSKADFAGAAGGAEDPSAGLFVLPGQPSRPNGTIRTNARTKERDTFPVGPWREELLSLVIIRESEFTPAFPFPAPPVFFERRHQARHYLKSSSPTKRKPLRFYRKPPSPRWFPVASGWRVSDRRAGH